MSGVERVVYVTESVLDIRELNSWVYVDGQYQGSGVHIEAIQDAQGQVHDPQLQTKWEEITEGMASRRQEVLPDNYSHELRVDAMYLPVRVLFRSWFVCIPQPGAENEERSDSESRYWVRYLRG